MKMRLKVLMATAAMVVAMAPMGAKAQGYGPGPRGGYGQVPGPHPSYLHALSDLRAARHYLNDNWSWGGVRHDDDAAVREIDAAIHEIKIASIDDGKGLSDPFPMDRRLGPRDRFGKANELLSAAMHDLDHAEDVPQSRGLRDRAMMHISQAHQIVDAAWRNAHWR
jgi:hypothetical protein